jgi:hypothetical protein
MRNPVFKSIEPNYKRKTLEIGLQEGRKTRRFSLPFAALPHAIDTQNRFRRLEVDPDTANMGVEYELEDGSTGSFPSDFVLYYCDPAYDWSPLNQLKRALRQELQSNALSVRVIADALQTSPSQISRLLEEENVPKQFRQLVQLAYLVGKDVEIRLRERPA